jgi:hypothetical protein
MSQRQQKFRPLFRLTLAFFSGLVVLCVISYQHRQLHQVSELSEMAKALLSTSPAGEEASKSDDDILTPEERADPKKAIAEIILRQFKKWEGYRRDVPLWMQKNVTLMAQLEHPPDVVPDDKRICFVHVGKTAGTTLACYFGFLYDKCVRDGEEIKMAPGLLPQYTTHLTHTGFNDCTDHHFEYYLFVLRNPLHRIQSWFTYELPINGNGGSYRQKKQKRLFDDCEYGTLSDLGEKGLEGMRNKTTGDASLCQIRAWMAIQGMVGYSTHNKYNFAYYLDEVEAVVPDPKIAVIRTEHLEEDWNGLEKGLLSGSPTIDVKFPRKNASPKRSQDLELSERARQNLCDALCEEIQVYKKLLHRSVNLDAEAIQVSLNELKESCPVETMKETCAKPKME